jgi:hypothetical protein
VPLEGHAERLRTPLGRRDKQLLAAVAVVAAIALAAGGAYTIIRGGLPSDAGCVVVTVPGSMGGVTIRHCGAAAVRFCRIEAREDEAVAAACRRGGYTRGVPAATS